MLLKPAGFMRAQTGSSFTETAVSAPGTAYIDSDTALGSATYKSLLLFASVTPDSGAEGNRRGLLSFNDVDGGFHVNYDVGNSLYGGRTDIETDSTSGAFRADESVGLGDRYHLLWSAWHDGTNLNTVYYYYDTSAGSWSVGFNHSIADGGTFLKLGTSAVRIFNRNGDTTQGFIGDVYRVAWWVDTAASAIGDITQASVRNEFINGSSIANPATTQTTYSGATRICDFYGPASNYNTPSGHPDGDGGGDAGHTFATTGTFT